MKINIKTLIGGNFTTIRARLKSSLKMLVIPIFIVSISCNESTKSEKPEVDKEIPHTNHSMEMNETDSIKTKVAILVFPGVELLDFVGPAEVFRYTKGFEVYTISTDKKSVTTNENTLTFTADYTLDDAPTPDIVVVPGGPFDVLETAANSKTLEWIKKTNETATLTMSVCTGALLLSKAGLLDGKTATTHLVAVDLYQEWNPKAKFVHEGRFVQDGKILTSGGVSAGIDGALHVVESLKGSKEALNLTSIMEYNSWDPKNGLVLNIEDFPMARDDREKGMNVYDPSKTYAICKFPIGDEELVYNSTYNGQKYHFCSPACKNVFDKHPTVFSAH